MCTVSMMYDYMRQNTTPQQWTQPIYQDFTQIVKLLEEIDRKLGQKDCYDPAKAQFMKDIEDRLAKLEQKEQA